MGILYTDATGALPAMSINGNQCHFIAYKYDSNYIFVEPIKDVTDATIITAFGKVFQELKSKGIKPAFNVIEDNQAIKPIKSFLAKEGYCTIHGNVLSHTTSV